jgi:hypothetical protein
MDMRKTSRNRSLAVVLIGSLLIALCSGCATTGSRGGGLELKYHNIYMASLVGGVVGLIVGHQSDEDAAGAAIGAAVFGVGEFLNQLDNQPERERDLEEAAEEVAAGQAYLAPDYLSRP